MDHDSTKTAGGKSEVPEVPSIDTTQSPVEDGKDKYADYAQSSSSLFSMTGSFFFHAALFLLLLIILSKMPKGQSGTTLDPGTVVEGEIVVVNTTDDSQDQPFLDQEDFADPTEHQSQDDAGASAAKPESLQELLPDLPGLESMESSNPADGSSMSGVSQQAADSLNGSPSSKSTVGKSKIKFGGLVGEGSRFVYVIDRSGSMGENNRRLINAAKNDLITSMRGLPEHHQFQVIFYNSEPTVFSKGQGPVRLYFGTKANKKAAERFVRTVRADGGTDHYVALMEALKMNPDVIFLLTDADQGMSVKQRADVTRVNRARASINVIAFGAPRRPDKGILTFRTFARKNGGQFTYKTLDRVFKQ